jgi:hypothetical protein
MTETRKARLSDECTSATSKEAGRKITMFRVLELKGAGSIPATEVGRGYSTRVQAMAAIKMHLKTFKVSGRNPEGDYWWARDAEGLRKCWISAN